MLPRSGQRVAAAIRQASLRAAAQHHQVQRRTLAIASSSLNSYSRFKPQPQKRDGASSVFDSSEVSGSNGSRIRRRYSSSGARTFCSSAPRTAHSGPGGALPQAAMPAAAKAAAAAGGGGGGGGGKGGGKSSKRSTPSRPSVMLDNTRLFDGLGLTTFTDEDIGRAFDRHDTNGDGTLQRKEVEALFIKICRNYPQQDVNDNDDEERGREGGAQTGSGADCCRACTEATVASQVTEFMRKWEAEQTSPGGQLVVTKEAFVKNMRLMAETLDSRVYPLAASMLWVGVSVGIIIPVMPQIVQSLGISTSDFGLVISAFGLSKLLGNIPSAIAVDRMGRKPFLSYPLLLMAVGTSAMGLAGGVNDLIACRLLTGFGVAGFSTAAMMMISDISTPLNRTRTTAPVMASFSAGAALGPALGGILSSYVGVQPTFAAVGVMFALLAGVNYFKMTETLVLPAARGAVGGGGGGGGGGGSSPSSGQSGLWSTLKMTKQQWAPLLRNEKLQGIYGLNGAYWLAMAGSQMTLLPMVLVSPQFGLTPASLGVVFGGMSVVSVLGAQPMAAVADRFGKGPSILIGCGTVSSAMLLLPMATQLNELAAVVGLWALGSTTLGSAPVAHVVDIAPVQSRAQGMALLRTLGDVGLCLGATVAGAVADVSSLGTAMQLNAGVLLGVTAWFASKEGLLPFARKAASDAVATTTSASAATPAAVDSDRPGGGAGTGTAAPAAVTASAAAAAPTAAGQVRHAGTSPAPRPTKDV